MDPVTRPGPFKQDAFARVGEKAYLGDEFAFLAEAEISLWVDALNANLARQARRYRPQSNWTDTRQPTSKQGDNPWRHSTRKRQLPSPYRVT